MYTNQISIVGRLSLVALGVIGIALLNPSSPITSFATDDAGSERMASGASSIAVSLGGQADMAVLPTAAGSLATTSTDLIILATNTLDYKVYINPIDEKNTSLTPVDLSNEHTIEPISSSAVLANFPANTWGYSLAQSEPDSNTLYQPLVSSSDPVKEVTTETDTTDRYKLSFGVKVDNSLPAGFYTNKVVASVVATPAEVAELNTLSDIDYMQEMTSTICENSAEHETKQLIDSRDGKSYWVAKLKDGNCWMTQNLALDLSTDVALIPENSDIFEDWTPMSSTEIEIPIKTDGDDNSQRSWDLGKIVFTELSESGYYSNVLAGQKVTDVHFPAYIDVTSGWTNGYIATVTSSIDWDSETYDSHYLIGNYYQYNTATAGTGIGVVGTNATGANGEGLTNASGSICPKGWQLPKSGKNTSATDTIFGVKPEQSYDIDGSFYGLISRYGYRDTTEYGTWGDAYFVTPESTRLEYNPIYFARDGFISLDYGALRGVGGTGAAWSSTAYTGSIQNPYSIVFDTALVSPSTDARNRYDGLHVRCVAR